MSTISARFVADMLEVALKRTRSRHVRERMDLTPKQMASWLMCLVIDLQNADSFDDMTDEIEKEIEKGESK